MLSARRVPSGRSTATSARSGRSVLRGSGTRSAGEKGGKNLQDLQVNFKFNKTTWKTASKGEVTFSGATCSSTSSNGRLSVSESELEEKRKNSVAALERSLELQAMYQRQIRRQASKVHFFQADVVPRIFSIGFDFFNKTNQELANLVVEIVSQLQLQLNPSSSCKLRPLVGAILEGYLANPYHNAAHGFGVFHFAALFLTLNPAAKNSLTSNTALAFLLAALGHDIGHPGHTNQYEEAMSTQLARTCRNSSILETLHVCHLRELFRNQEYNVFSELEPREQNEIKKFVTDLVLSTDATFSDEHKKTLTRVKSLDVYLDSSSRYFSGRKTKLFTSVLHAFDLGAQCTDLEVALQWERRIAKEFRNEARMLQDESLAVPNHLAIYLSSDEEQELTKKEAEAEVEFLTKTVQPLWQEVCRFSVNMRGIFLQIATNKRYYKLIAERKHREATKYFKERTNRNVLVAKVYKKVVQRDKNELGPPL